MLTVKWMYILKTRLCCYKFYTTFKQIKCILVQLEDKRQSLSLKSHEELQQKRLKFVPRFSSVLVLSRHTSAVFPSAQKELAGCKIGNSHRKFCPSSTSNQPKRIMIFEARANRKHKMWCPSCV